MHETAGWSPLESCTSLYRFRCMPLISPASVCESFDRSERTLSYCSPPFYFWSSFAGILAMQECGWRRWNLVSWSINSRSTSIQWRIGGAFCRTRMIITTSTWAFCLIHIEKNRKSTSCRSVRSIQTSRVGETCRALVFVKCAIYLSCISAQEGENVLGCSSVSDLRVVCDGCRLPCGTASIPIKLLGLP